jgi:type I restriction enzyme M protein
LLVRNERLPPSLEEQEATEELKAIQTKKPMEKRFFPEGRDNNKSLHQDFRWNRFKNFDSREMYTVVSEYVVPWLRTLSGNGTTYSEHMEASRFTIPTPALLAKVADTVDNVPMEDRDTMAISTNTCWARLPDQESLL